MTSSRSWSEAVLHNAMIYQSKCKPGDLLQHQWITAQAPALRTHISTATATRANSIDATGTIYQDSTHLPSAPYVSYKIFEQIIYNQQQQPQPAFYGIPSIQVHRLSHRG